MRGGIPTPILKNFCTLNVNIIRYKILDEFRRFWIQLWKKKKKTTKYYIEKHVSQFSLEGD